MPETTCMTLYRPRLLSQAGEVVVVASPSPSSLASPPLSRRQLRQALRSRRNAPVQSASSHPADSPQPSRPLCPLSDPVPSDLALRDKGRRPKRISGRACTSVVRTRQARATLALPRAAGGAEAISSKCDQGRQGCEAGRRGVVCCSALLLVGRLAVRLMYKVRAVGGQAETFTPPLGTSEEVMVSSHFVDQL